VGLWICFIRPSPATQVPSSRRIGLHVRKARRLTDNIAEFVTSGLGGGPTSR